MPGKRFWPPTEHRLLYANIIIYALIIILLLLFHRELIWAQKALRGYLFTGQLDPPASNLLMLEAMQHPNKGRGAERHHQLLQKAYQIDPYSLASLMLGDYYAEQGREDIAMDHYNRFRSLDPSFVDVYFRIGEILKERGDHKALSQLLEEGTAFLKKRAALYKSHYNPSVRREFNLKALKIYNASIEGLRKLEKAKEELKHSEKFQELRK